MNRLSSSHRSQGGHGLGLLCDTWTHTQSWWSQRIRAWSRLLSQPYPRAPPAPRSHPERPCAPSWLPQACPSQPHWTAMVRGARRWPRSRTARRRRRWPAWKARCAPGPHVHPECQGKVLVLQVWTGRAAALCWAEGQPHRGSLARRVFGHAPRVCASVPLQHATRAVLCMCEFGTPYVCRRRRTLRWPARPIGACPTLESWSARSPPS
jgi:hypothetical protein